MKHSKQKSEAGNKRNYKKQAEGLHEVVYAFKPEEAAEDGLFDDCPLCQELRGAIARNEACAMPFPIGDEMMN